MVSLELYGHPFSSYTWKALIPLWADGTAFEYRKVFEDPDASARLAELWPFAKFPTLVDNGQVIPEATCIIEHLQANHATANVWIPDGELGRRVRFLDRFFDLYVQGSFQPSVNHALGKGDAAAAEQGRKALHVAYDSLPPEYRDLPAVSALPFAQCLAACIVCCEGGKVIVGLPAHEVCPFRRLELAVRKLQRLFG